MVGIFKSEARPLANPAFEVPEAIILDVVALFNATYVAITLTGIGFAVIALNNDGANILGV